jgi:hypothetical protein
MTIGTGIFWGSLLLSLVTLYGITRDRWNWTDILKRFGIGVLIVCVLIAGGFAWSYYNQERAAEKDRLAEQEAEKAAALEKRRTAKARLCISEDVTRMEALLRNIQSALHARMSLEDARATLDGIAGSQGRVLPGKDDIHERVLIYNLRTKCDSPFQLLVNVRADQYGALKWLSVFAEDPPQGYPPGMHREFSTNFIAERAQAALAALGPPPMPKRASVSHRTETAPASKDSLGADGDPCAPNLTRTERVQRLAAFGSVRQTGEGEYEAGNHHVSFLLNTLTLVSCH